MGRFTVQCEIIKIYGVLGIRKDKLGNPCKFRLCKVSWQGADPTWDLRVWSAENKPLKGVTLNDDQIHNLKEILNGINII